MTLTPEEFYVDVDHPYEGKNWVQLRTSSVVVPASYWGELKATFIKTCRKNGNCPPGWEEKLEQIDERVGY